MLPTSWCEYTFVWSPPKLERAGLGNQQDVVEVMMCESEATSDRRHSLQLAFPTLTRRGSSCHDLRDKHPFGEVHVARPSWQQIFQAQSGLQNVAVGNVVTAARRETLS